MTQDIFISYRRHDSAFFAAKLRDRLEQTFPGQVFLDVSGIDAGDNFVEKLKSAVSASKAVVAVISPGWLASRNGRTQLGEEGDFVTEEIATALEAGIATVPVLIEGAQMPRAAELPPRLRNLPGRHAVSVSHERFDSDSNLLVDQLFKPLGIKPPNKLERVLALALVAGGFSQRTRDQYALASLVAAALGVLLTGLWVVVSRSDPLELLMPLAVSGLALALGILGRNSLHRRWAAVCAILISVSTLAVALPMGAWRAYSLPLNPWFDAVQTARLHATEPELPSERIAWSNRVPFTVPPPTVDCACFALLEKPPGRLPYAPDVKLTFKNGCGGCVTFVVSRSTNEGLANALPWFAASGREFAVITLGPEQVVRVPVGDTYGGAYQPWICGRDAPAR